MRERQGAIFFYFYNGSSVGPRFKITEVFGRKDSARILLLTATSWMWWEGSTYPFLRKIGKKNILFVEVKEAMNVVIENLDFVQSNLNYGNYPQPVCVDSIFCRLLAVVEKEFKHRNEENQPSLKNCDKEMLQILTDMIKKQDLNTKAQIHADMIKGISLGSATSQEMP